MLHFSLTILNDVDPELVRFQTERPLSDFFYEKLKEVVVSLLQMVAQPVLLENVIRRLLKQDFSVDVLVLPML